MSYDANKKANALQVRKFYGQNKYGFKPFGWYRIIAGSLILFALI
jgi:hypothetical protein